MFLSADTREDVWTDKGEPPEKAHYNDLMLALRYAYVLALVVWLGGMVVLGALVAPTTFQVLQAAAPDTGRALAGELFGVLLARFHYVAYGTGAVLFLTLAAMAILGPRPAAFAIRLGIITVMQPERSPNHRRASSGCRWCRNDASPDRDPPTSPGKGQAHAWPFVFVRPS